MYIEVKIYENYYERILRVRNIILIIVFQYNSKINDNVI